MNRRKFSLGVPGVAGMFVPPVQAQHRSESVGASEPFRRALLDANPELSKFNPLRRILFFDQFDNGHNGWTELQANHNGNWMTCVQRCATYGRLNCLAATSLISVHTER
jgi:hypothetical protein